MDTGLDRASSGDRRRTGGTVEWVLKWETAARSFQKEEVWKAKERELAENEDVGFKILKENGGRKTQQWA